MPEFTTDAREMFAMKTTAFALAFTAATLAAGTTSPAAEPAKVEAAEVSAAELEKALKGQKGKVVVVDCWATWCVPCVKKFPHLVEMHNKYADKGLVCVSLSADKLSNPKGYMKDKVVDFLKEKKATFPNFILADPKTDDEALVKLLGEYSSLPYMIVLDKNGKRVWNSDDGPKLTDAELEKLIETELAK
jgi:thiol-disulfide isomerase/thioredoxin